MDVRRPIVFSQQPNTCTDSDGSCQPRHTGTDNKEDMLRSDIEIDRLQYVKLKDDLIDAQKAISLLSTRLHASYLALNMTLKAIENAMSIIEIEYSLALADYDWISVKTRVREALNKAPDNLLNQNDLKKEVGNVDASMQTLNKQVAVLQKEVAVNFSTKVCAVDEIEKFKASSDSVSNLHQESTTQLDQQ
eukprot:15346494-Ditylum_brightwellii.AAC.1